VTKTIAAFAVLAVLAPGFASAEERPHHGYGGGGLYLTSATLDAGSGGSSADSGGAGFFLAGAGVFNVASQVGIGLNGGFFAGSRTFDDSDEDVGEAQFAVDAGGVFFDLLYVTLGVQSYAYTFENPDVTFSYVTVPLGIGVFKATDSGYLLGQVRFGGGTASEDAFDTEEDIGFVGIRVMGQIGAANGVQFLGGLDLDSYDFDESETNDNYFRLFLGCAFGT